MARKKGQKKTGKRAERSVASPSARPPVARGWFHRNRLIIILLGVTALVMSPVVFNDFISIDDEQFITGNKIVQNADVGRALTKQMYSPHYKPLVYLSWIAEVAVFGNNPHVIHFNNLLLHLANTLLVFFIMLRITRFWPETRAHDVSIAFFSALLFGVHPLHVESVAWAIERKDVLFSVFYLGGLLAYLRSLGDGKKKWIYLAALLYMLSMLSKSMGITLIALTVLLDWANGRRDWKLIFLEKWPFVIPLLTGLFLYGFLYHPASPAGAAAGIAELGDGAVAPPENIAGLPGLYQQILIAAYRYCFFFLHTLVPVNLAIVYPRTALINLPGGAIHLSFALIALIAALPWILKKYRDVLITGILLFTVALSPILIEEGPGTNFGSDRYTYIPSLGLFLIITTLCCHALKRMIGRASAGQLVLGMFALALAAGAFVQARKWGSSFELYDQAVNNYPNNVIALHYRGGALEDTDPQAAIRDYSKSIELNDARFRPVFARGTLYLKLGRHQEAIADFTRTLELNPRYEKAWVNRGNAYRDLGQNDAAIGDYNEALKIYPRFDKALNNRGAAYLNKGMYNEALQDFNRVIEYDPSYVHAYVNRAALYINPNVKQYEAAIRDYDKALQLDPSYTQARYFRGVALRALGRNTEALEDLNQAIAMNPNNGMYYFTRAQALRNLGRHQESVQDARKAKSLGYQVPAEYLN